MFRLNTLLDYNRMNSQKQPESYENGRENLRKLKVEIPLFKIPHSTTPYTSANSRIMYNFIFLKYLGTNEVTKTRYENIKITKTIITGVNLSTIINF